MATQPSHPQPVSLPHIAVAHAVLARFRSGEPVDRPHLGRLFEAATGRSDASGAWSMREAYDALEFAQTLFLLDPACPLLAGSPSEILGRLEAFAHGLPVQSYRSEGQVVLQQFSTPLPLAWLVGLAAAPRAGEVVLEPSAGNGLLAWAAARRRPRLLLNEIDPTRRRSLEAAFPEAVVSGHDAELIDDLLAPGDRPTLVMMNPPFARSGGRGVDRHAAARHLAAALMRLQPGGRLVALMPESYSEFGSGRDIRQKIEKEGSLRLDALVAPGAFARHGTGVPVRLVVYDKV